MDMKDTILFGDCRKTIPTITEPVKMCVTSPPYYGLRNYGDEENQIGMEESPEKYIEQLVEVFRSVRDVLTDDGILWVNIGDTYYNYRSDGNYPKQTVSKTNQDLPEECNRRANKLTGQHIFLGILPYRSDSPLHHNHEVHNMVGMLHTFLLFHQIL